MPRFVLCRQQQHRGASDVGTLSRLNPGQAMQPVLDGCAHQVMPGRMELDFIAAVAEAVMRVQHRFVFVGLESPALHLFCPEPSSEFPEPPVRPSGLFAPNRFRQGSVSEIEVRSRQRRRLVENLMGDFGLGNFKRIHKLSAGNAKTYCLVARSMKLAIWL